MPEPTLIAVSGKTGAGIAEWLAWLEARRAALRFERGGGILRLHVDRPPLGPSVALHPAT